MNKEEFKAEMCRNGDTQSTLAKAMGISRTSLNAKINERNDASFTQPEIAFIRSRYNLTSERIDIIFFSTYVSWKDTII